MVSSSLALQMWIIELKWFLWCKLSVRRACVLKVAAGEWSVESRECTIPSIGLKKLGGCFFNCGELVSTHSLPLCRYLAHLHKKLCLKIHFVFIRLLLSCRVRCPCCRTGHPLQYTHTFTSIILSNPLTRPPPEPRCRCTHAYCLAYTKKKYKKSTLSAANLEFRRDLRLSWQSDGRQFLCGRFFLCKWQLLKEIA